MPLTIQITEIAPYVHAPISKLPSNISDVLPNTVSLGEFEMLEINGPFCNLMGRNQ